MALVELLSCRQEAWLQIQGIPTLGGRSPSLDDIRRVLPDRPRLWGEDGRDPSQ